MIGIIGAMPIEVDGLRALMTDVETVERSKIVYHVGKLNGVPCVAAFSGVGKVNSAVCTQTMVLEFGVDKIINVGVAGGLLEDMNPGDIVLSSAAVQYDFDTTALGDPLGLIATIEVIELPCSAKLRGDFLGILSGSVSATTGQHGFSADDSVGECEANCGIAAASFRVFEGTIASGDKFINERKDLLKIRDTFGALACDMETASIAQVCYLNDVAFLAVRAISDNVNGENSRMDYESFKRSSAQLVCNIVHSAITEL